MGPSPINTGVKWHIRVEHLRWFHIFLSTLSCLVQCERKYNGVCREREDPEANYTTFEVRYINP
jgi:hypothetical protein